MAHSEMLQALTHNWRYAEGLAFGELAERKFPEEQDVAIAMARVRAFHDQYIQPLLALGRRFGDVLSFTVSEEIAVARFVRDDVDGALRVIERVVREHAGAQARRRKCGAAAPGRTHHDRAFGESPSYRAFMAGVDSEARP